MSNRTSRYGVKIDFISEVLIAVFLITILFAGLGGLIGTDQASYNLAVFMVVMELTAIGLWVVSQTYVIHPEIGRKEFANDAKYIIASLAAFFILNWVVPLTVPFAQTLGLSSLSLQTGGNFVTMMMSIPEESLFRGWAAPWFARRFGIIGGAVASGGAFAIYHVFVYGNPLAGNIVGVFLTPQTGIVFGMGVVFGFVALKTQRLYATMVPHFIANAISVGIL